MNALILTVELVLVVSLAYAVAWVAYRWKPQKEQKRKQKSKEHPNLLVPVLTAVAAFGQTEIFDHLEAYLADPRPWVSTEVKEREKEILISLKGTEPITTIAIDFSVPGRVVSVHDYNSPADAVTMQKSILGANVEGSLNNVELVLSDIKPDRLISFKILYEPIRQEIMVTGRDRWHMSYSWLYRGVMNTRTQWYLISTGQIVERPEAQVKDVLIIPRALSDEEIKKLYEEGPHRSLLNPDSAVDLS